MFELLNFAYNENIMRSKLWCDIQAQKDCCIVDFIQLEYSDINKWEKTKVLTDMFIRRFYLPPFFTDPTIRKKLAKYIIANYHKNGSAPDKIQTMSKSMRRIAISMPTTIYPRKMGLPTSARGYKDTCWPLIVKIDDQDVSSNFMDFEEFEDLKVQKAYQALLNGATPESSNDIFYIDGVKELHEKLKNGTPVTDSEHTTE